MVGIVATMPDNSNNPKTIEAIVFVPGFSLREKEDSLYKLGKIFENFGAEEVKSFEKNNCGVKQFKVENRFINVYEAYWQDLVEDTTKIALTDKVPRGIGTLRYWTFSGIYRAIRESQLLILYFTVFLLVLVCWYLFTLLLIFSQVVKEVDIEFLKGFKPIIGWVWLVNTFLVGILPVNEAATLADFCKNYFENGFTEYKINKRVSDVLDLVLEESYSEITVVGYSIGAVIASKSLANLSKANHIRYITLGSPLKFFSLKSSKVNRHLSEVVNSCKNNIEEWIEYYSSQDLVNIKWLPAGRYSNMEIKSIQLNDPKGKKIKAFSFVSILGQSHSFYFYSQEVIRTILKLT